MKTVNYGNNYNHRLSLRLSDVQMDFILEVSKELGVSPSEYIRMLLNTVASKKVGTHSENVKANKHNIL